MNIRKVLKSAAVCVLVSAMLSSCQETTDHNFLDKYKKDISITVSEEELSKKMEGAFIGQMVGAAWSAALEFRADQNPANPLPESMIPTWYAPMINDSFGQEDLYYSIAYIKAMDNTGVLIHDDRILRTIGGMDYKLWHSAKKAVDNYHADLDYENCSSYEYNAHFEDTDWMMASEFVGMVYPGLVNSAITRAYELGCATNSGDGVLGGVFVAAMHSAAFYAESIEEIAYAGIKAIPEESHTYQILMDVATWYNEGVTWQDAYRMLYKKWGGKGFCDDIPDGYDISAQFNAGCVLIGLLYGGGDFTETMRITMLCGNDADCNTSCAASVVGCFIGADQIDETYTAKLKKEDQKFTGTDYTFKRLIKKLLSLTFDVMVTEDISYTKDEGITGSIQVSGDIIPAPYVETNEDAPRFTIDAVDVGDCTALLSLSVKNPEDLGNYTISWKMGDGKTINGQVAAYSYDKASAFKVECTITGENGKSNSQSKIVSVTADSFLQLMPISSAENPSAGGNPYVMVDNITPSKGSEDASQQYRVYDNGDGLYVGVEFEATMLLEKIKFQEGIHNDDGGWWKVGEIAVEVLKNGEWVSVEATNSARYSKINGKSAQGSNYETFTFELAEPVECDGVRFVGSGGGTSQYVTVGEITVDAKFVDAKAEQKPLGALLSSAGGDLSKSGRITAAFDGKTDAESAAYKLYMTGNGYIGSAFRENQTVSGVHLYYSDSGKAFENPIVQYLKNGEWLAVEQVAVKEENDGKLLKFSFESISNCEGIRICGGGHGENWPISVLEFEIVE